MRDMKNVLKISILAMTILILLGMSCQASLIKRSIEKPSLKFVDLPAPKTVYITDEDSGSHFTLNLGDKINLTLDHLASQGYSWEFLGIIQPVFIPSDTDYKPILELESFKIWGFKKFITDDGFEVAVIGGPLKATWIFNAINSGYGILKFRCYQPWPDGDPGWTFSVSITVQ